MIKTTEIVHSILLLIEVQDIVTVRKFAFVAITMRRGDVPISMFQSVCSATVIVNKPRVRFHEYALTAAWLLAKTLLHLQGGARCLVLAARARVMMMGGFPPGIIVTNFCMLKFPRPTPWHSARIPFRRLN